MSGRVRDRAWAGWKGWHCETPQSLEIDATNRMMDDGTYGTR